MREREGRRGASGVIWEVKGGAKEKKRSKEAEREKAATDGDEKRVVAAKRKEAKRPCSIRRLCKPLGSCLCQLRCSRDVRVQRARCGGLKSSKSRRKRHGEDDVFFFFPFNCQRELRSLARSPPLPGRRSLRIESKQTRSRLLPLSTLFSPKKLGTGRTCLTAEGGRARSGKGGERRTPFSLKKELKQVLLFFLFAEREK